MNSKDVRARVAHVRNDVMVLREDITLKGLGEGALSSAEVQRRQIDAEITRNERSRIWNNPPARLSAQCQLY